MVALERSNTLHSVSADKTSPDQFSTYARSNNRTSEAKVHHPHDTLEH